MGVEILSQQTIIGHDEEGGLDVGIVEPQRLADGSIYRVDVGYAGVNVCSQDDSLTFQQSLGGEFDNLLVASVKEKSRRIGEKIRTAMPVLITGKKKYAER
jgi:hypothetical protein